ncbi:MAG: YjdF family protein [Lachnospiraceae bacterium]|nr:YjdF family protein [Lachnospiraceae bacterium]
MKIWQFAVICRLPDFCGKMGVYVAVKDGRVNPKRGQREAARQAMQAGIGTKSQQALQLQREERNMERRQADREQREARKERLFEMKQQKRKEKHRGR